MGDKTVIWLSGKSWKRDRMLKCFYLVLNPTEQPVPSRQTILIRQNIWREALSGGREETEGTIFRFDFHSGRQPQDGNIMGLAIRLVLIAVPVMPPKSSGSLVFLHINNMGTMSISQSYCEDLHIEDT